MNLRFTANRSALPAAGVALRATVAGFFGLTSLYSLLAFVPFTYEQVHRGALVPALNTFGQVNHIIFWFILLLVAGAFAFEPLPVNRRRARTAIRLRAGFWILHIPVALAMNVRPVFASMESNVWSYVWALVLLEPLLYLAAIIWWERWPGIRWSTQSAADDLRVFFAAWGSAVFLSMIYSLVAAWRGQNTLTLVDRMFSVSTSLLSHLMVFLALFVVLNLIAVVANWFDRPPLAQFVICYLFGGSMLMLVLKSLVFTSISFAGPTANLYAFAFSASITIFLAAISISSHTPGSEQVQSGLSLALWLPASGHIPFSWLRALLSAGAVGAAGMTLAIGSARMDWNHLFQKLTALLIWVVAFRLFYAAGIWKIDSGRHRTGRLLLAAMALLPAYRLTEAAENYVWPRSGSPVTFARFLDTYCGFDPSYKLIHDSLGSGTVDGGYYQFLASNTNLPRSTVIKPVAMDVAGPLEKSAGGVTAAGDALPHIFIVTIDSLRRDYLSPYNRSVKFTPQIEKFGEESVVMSNSYTRYGGTGLSEPSIWVGGMMIHQQYVTPFSPMNSLQRVLDAHDYKMFVSRDSILQTVVAETPNLEPLDEGLQSKDYDLCTSLKELESKLDATARGPVFGYTQPQNIHISSINREGAKVIDDGSYGSFYPPYASRLRRIDGCFGDFVQKLKDRNLYDKSIIVLTADHGDSLGEEGRWGHAYTIYPEILRIPLIIHLPASMRGKYQAKSDAIAFNSDISPTIHYLLGHRPIAKNEMFGRPLFTEKAEEQNGYKRDHYLVSSSYASVHGILSGDGKFLYTSDAVNYKELWFDMTETTPGAHRATSSMRLEYQKLIREKMGIINQFYQFTPPAQSTK